MTGIEQGKSVQGFLIFQKTVILDPVVGMVGRFNPGDGLSILGSVLVATHQSNAELDQHPKKEVATILGLDLHGTGPQWAMLELQEELITMKTVSRIHILGCPGLTTNLTDIIKGQTRFGPFQGFTLFGIHQGITIQRNPDSLELV